MLLALAVCTAGCGGGNGAGGTAALRDEVAYADIEPVSFAFQQGAQRLDLTSSPARLWYVFQPADTAPDTKPLFVFFNGGPGCATSNGLLSLNTSRRAIDHSRTGGRAVTDNPDSWTALGNLLYIDARLTGFSYDLMADPEDHDARHAEFDAQNFNPYLDAADALRLLLRFLAAHLSLQGRPVVLVAESYGGERATIMLDLLLQYQRHAAGEALYRDDALVDEIRAHLAAVFPELGNDPVPPEVVARQFGRQILIEPVLSGGDQFAVSGAMYEAEGSPLYQIAVETDTAFTPCAPQDDNCDPFDNALTFVDSVAKRDIYAYPQPRDWLVDRFLDAADVISHAENFSRLIGADIAAVRPLRAAERLEAYRVIDVGDQQPGSGEFALPITERLRRAALRRAFSSAMTPPVFGNFNDQFGVLRDWDRYFIFCHNSVTDAFYDNQAIAAGFPVGPLDDAIGELFLHNAALVHTFITDAAEDLVVYAAALPGALARHDDLVAAVDLDAGAPAGAARPGEIVLTYQPGVLTDPSPRTIRFPHYAASGHSVTVFQPDALFADVEAWLRDTN